MIVILSNDTDKSTNDVIDWLVHFEAEVVRFNYSSQLEVISIDIVNQYMIFRFKDVSNKWIRIDTRQVSAFWYRRGNINYNIITYKLENEALKRYLESEMDILIEYMHYILKEKIPNINSFLDNSINKLIVLDKAISVGLKVPETFLSHSIKDIAEYNNDKEYIVKAINHGAFYDDKSYSGGTFLIENIIIDKRYKFPFLIQHKIEKVFELRIFYMHGKIYSTAIFSQGDEKTKIDFRNYNREKENRVVPYSLPKNEFYKLQKLMGLLNMNCGSIDMVLNSNGEYVFLEVNPVGQFMQVSIPGSYYLEKNIAKTLINL